MHDKESEKHDCFLHNILLYRFILEVSYRIPPCGSTKDPPPDWWYTIVRR